MMEKLAVFLRGVNVNGINMKMEELRAVIEAMGYREVKTILASGNVVLTTEEGISCEIHKSRIEAELSAHFGYEAYLILKTAQQIHEMIAEAMTHTVPEGCHHYILLSKDNTIGEQLQNLFHTCSKAEQEQLLTGDHGIYWIVPKGNTLESEFGTQVLGKKVWKSKLTSRTINTVQKLAKHLN